MGLVRWHLWAECRRTHLCALPRNQPPSQVHERPVATTDLLNILLIADHVETIETGYSSVIVKNGFRGAENAGAVSTLRRKLVGDASTVTASAAGHDGPEAGQGDCAGNGGLAE